MNDWQLFYTTNIDLNSYSNQQVQKAYLGAMSINTYWHKQKKYALTFVYSNNNQIEKKIYLIFLFQ